MRLALFILVLANMACSLLASPAQPEKTGFELAETEKPAPTISATTTVNPTQKPENDAKLSTRSFCTVTADSLHLRASPGEHARVEGYLRSGDLLKRTGETPAGAWVEVISPGGLLGWVNSKYIDCQKGS